MGGAQVRWRLIDEDPHSALHELRPDESIRKVVASVEA
jgi:hypothetical protein